MKRNSLFSVLCIVMLMLFMVLPLMAQDDGVATNTPAGLTVQPADIEAAATDEVAATVEPGSSGVVINIEQQDTPVTAPAPASDNTFERLALLAALVLMVIDKISGHFLSLKLANMVPLEWRQTAGQAVENAQRTGLKRAYERTRETPDTWDDKLLDEGAKIVGWEFITNPDGSVTPRRIAVPAPSTGSIG